MQFYNDLKAHLADNTGDENVSKLIWIAIVFVVGAALLLLMITAFSGADSPLGVWLSSTMDSWFNNGGEQRPDQA